MKKETPIPHIANKQRDERHMQGLRGVDGDDAISQAGKEKDRQHYDKLVNPRRERNEG